MLGQRLYNAISARALRKVKHDKLVLSRVLGRRGIDDIGLQLGTTRRIGGKLVSLETLIDEDQALDKLSGLVTL